MIDRWFPTTKLCVNCGAYNDNLKLSDRKFVCSECGTIDDRDIHAAKNMIWIYDNIVAGPPVVDTIGMCLQTRRKRDLGRGPGGRVANAH